jgi:ribonucleotide monophosphatase NagD (HAD superfamily)
MSLNPRPLIRGLLIDVSGTLQVGSSPTPGAVLALDRLRSAGLPFKLCSNTSKESTQSLVSRLTAQGFDIRYEAESQSSKEVWTSIGVSETNAQTIRTFKVTYTAPI